MIIRDSESYGNKTGTVDGGGFDLDGGLTNSQMTRNHSHDNQGAGYGVFQFQGARPFHSNVVCFNVSRRDGDGVYVYDDNGDMGSVEIYGNVVESCRSGLG